MSFLRRCPLRLCGPPGTPSARALQLTPEDLSVLFFCALTLDQIADYRGALNGYRRFLRLAEKDESQHRNVKTARTRIDELRRLVK